MRPVEDLTVDEAVAELETVYDSIGTVMPGGRLDGQLKARIADLEKYIVEHPDDTRPAEPVQKSPETEHVAEESPVAWPKGKPRTPKDKDAISQGVKASTPYNRRQRLAPPRTEQVQALAARPDPPVNPRKVIDAEIEVDASETFRMMTQVVLNVMREAVSWTPEQREAYTLAAGNLDALTHQLALFLATGRVECAA